jgi:hypothetical protein
MASIVVFSPSYKLMPSTKNKTAHLSIHCPRLIAFFFGQLGQVDIAQRQIFA